MTSIKLYGTRALWSILRCFISSRYLTIFSNPDKWVFVLGCYNSGTTLLERLIASHPDVGSLAGEGQTLTNQLLKPSHVGLPRLWALQPSHFYMGERAGNANPRLLKLDWCRHFNDAGKPVLVEKSVPNAARICWLDKHFKNAHFVAIVRNGYAVCEGIRRKAGHALPLAATQWSRSNEIMLRDLESVPHKLIVRYEDLTEHPETVWKEILAFLKLSQTRADEIGMRRWVIRERCGRIRNFNEESIAKLSDTDLDTIERHASEMLLRLKYPRRTELQMEEMTRETSGSGEYDTGKD